MLSILTTFAPVYFALYIIHSYKTYQASHSFFSTYTYYQQPHDLYSSSHSLCLPLLVDQHVLGGVAKEEQTLSA